MEHKSNKPSADEPLTEVHKLLGMTPLDVWTDMEQRGLDPEAEIESMRRLGRVMAAKYADQCGIEELLPIEMTMPLQTYDESVAAGTPTWNGTEKSKRLVSILDAVRHGDAKGVIVAKVSGWSMRDESIKDGDNAIVDTTIEAKDGDIVLANIEGQGQVIKRLRIKDGYASLESANPDFANIIVSDPTQLKIHGVVIGRYGKI